MSAYKRGDKFTLPFRVLTIMAVADGYIMCRYKGCMPFVKSVKEFPIFLEAVK